MPKSTSHIWVDLVDWYTSPTGEPGTYQLLYSGALARAPWVGDRVDLDEVAGEVEHIERVPVRVNGRGATKLLVYVNLGGRNA